MSAFAPARPRPGFLLLLLIVAALLAVVVWFGILAYVLLAGLELNLTFPVFLALEAGIPGVAFASLLLLVGVAVYRSRPGSVRLFGAFVGTEVFGLLLSLTGVYVMGLGLLDGPRSLLVPDLLNYAGVVLHGLALVLLLLLVQSSRPTGTRVASATSETSIPPT